MHRCKLETPAFVVAVSRTLLPGELYEDDDPAVIARPDLFDKVAEPKPARRRTAAKQKAATNEDDRPAGDE